MKSCFLYFAITLPFLVISFFALYPVIFNRQRIFKVGNQILVLKRDDLYYEWHEMVAKYLKFPLDHHYGSHAIVLLAVLYASKTGPILELGMGSSSTPLLHRLAKEQKRLLVSADSDRRWINHFASFAKDNSLHQMKYIEVNSEMGVEWAQSGLAYLQNWTVVFIDHRPGPRRQFELLLYADHSDIVILHDTEKSSLYKYDQGLSVYPYHYRFDKLKTHTDILSRKNESIISTVRYLLEATPNSYFLDPTSK